MKQKKSVTALSKKSIAFRKACGWENTNNQSVGILAGSFLGLGETIQEVNENILYAKKAGIDEIRMSADECTIKISSRTPSIFVAYNYNS